MPGDKTANVSPKTKNPPNNQRKSPKSSDQDLANAPIKNKRTDIIFKVSYFIFCLRTCCCIDYSFPRWSGLGNNE